MSGYINLIVASLFFVGTHFAMSHTLRPAMVRIFGRSGFMVVYSILSLIFLIWMVLAFSAAPKSSGLWAVNGIFWAISSFVTLLAAILYCGSMYRNPALPSPGASEYAGRMPDGVFCVTRHPMMWSFALWAVAHILIAPRPDVFIFMFALIFLALVGAWAQQDKKLDVMGVEWEMWLRRTSFWPNLGGFTRVKIITYVFGFTLWLFATWAHSYFGQAGAGIFRWL
jgi:uncharacterized membrane protein